MPIAAPKTRSVAAALALGAAIAAASSCTPSYAADAPSTHTVVAPDTGPANEGAGTEGIPAIAPDGTLVYRGGGPTSPTHAAHDATVYRWIPGHAVADGMRIRRTMVNGTVLGTVPREASIWISCKRHAGDGFDWGWVSYRGITGWARGDLWEVDQNTAPGGGGTPTVPWC